MFVDINTQDSNGWTPLSYATVKGNIVMIKHLLKLNAHPDACTSNSNYPIHYAASLAASDNHEERKRVMRLLKY